MLDLGNLSANEVIREADSVVEPALKGISVADIQLHDAGYHAWSTALANMRNKIERAFSELVDEVSE